MTPMVNLGIVLRRLGARLRRGRLDDELREEIDGHIERRRQQLIDDGMAPANAAREARRMFGNPTAIREETRDMWTVRWMENLAQDTRFGARLLRRSPAFTVAAVASLAIGIGAAAAVFSLTDHILLRPLPVKSPQELVLFRWVSGPDLPLMSLNGYSGQSETESSSTSFALKAYERMTADLNGEAEIFAFADLYRANLTLGGQPETVLAQAVSGNYFDTLGVMPAAGRLLAPLDDRADAPAAAVIGHDLWQRRFGGAADAVGRVMVLNGVSFTVAGVLPRGFTGTMQVGQDCDVMVPLSTYRAVSRSNDDVADPNNWWVLIMGRLRPGATAARLEAAADAIVKQTVREAMADLPAAALPRVRVESGAQGQTESRNNMVEPLKIMGAAVAVVLLVACANLANLLLARGRARAREVAVRTAIGAPRARLIRQLLTEGLLLGFLASALGLALAHWLAAALIPALSPDHGPMTIAFALDLRIVTFTCALAMASSLLFALVPALRTTGVVLAPALQEGSRGTIGMRRRVASGGVLVVAQVAMSMLLLSAAGVLAWSAYRLQRADPGFNAVNLLTFSIDTSRNGYAAARSKSFIARALDGLRAVPGVTGASITSHRLIANSSSSGITLPEGAPELDPDSAEARDLFRTQRTWRQVVDDRAFATLEIPLLRGRTWSSAIDPDAPGVAVVNVALARQLFGTDDVVGRRFKGGVRPGANAFEIVGVARDAHYTSLRAAPPPTAYYPYQQATLNRVTFVVRTAGDPMTLVPTIRETLRTLDDRLPLFDLRTQQDQILRSLAQERLFAGLALLLGTVTLALSGIGLYGLLAYAVTQRTPEIGIRIALGAERGQVRWMVLRQSLVLLACGLALGIPGAWASASLVESLLVGLEPNDPRVIAAAAVVLVGVGLAAAIIPARRASRIDPLAALRAE